MIFFRNFKVQLENYKIIFKKNRTLFIQIFRFIIAFAIGLILSVLFSEIDPFKSFIKNSFISNYLTKTLVTTTNFFLYLFGFETNIQNNFVQIPNTSGVIFVFSCIGIRHMIFFAGFIFSYYGKIINKIWYILTGFIILIILNSFRASIICITQFYYPNYFDIVHYYFTRIVMYFGIFILWMIWIRFFGTKKVESTSKSH